MKKQCSLIKVSIKSKNIQAGCVKKGIAIFYTVADLVEYLRPKKIDYDIDRNKILSPNSYSYEELAQMEIWPNRSVVDPSSEPFEIVIEKYE